MKDDNISRRAAIDAVEELDIPEDMCVFEILSHIEVALGTLPSAQSDTCAGCKWEDAMSFGECCHCKRGYDDMYDGGELKGENE